MDEKSARMFHDAYISANEPELDRLWKQVAPKRLIKFFPAQYMSDGTNYALDCITNQKLWMSSPKQFNDPFDCVVNVDYEHEALEISRSILEFFVGETEACKMLNSHLGKEALKKSYEVLRAGMSNFDRQTEQSIYVSCFSEIDNVHSLRMWAHYANNHKGVCVEYDFTDVNKACAFGCIPVMYTNNYSLQRDYIRDGVSRLLSLVYKKALEWEYEREWRLSAIIDGVDSIGYKVDFSVPKCIYLGSKAEERLKEEVHSYCVDKGIALYQMRLHPGSYNLDADRIV